MENVGQRKGMPVVTHLTQVKLRLELDKSYWGNVCKDIEAAPAAIRRVGQAMAGRAERVAAMMELMAANGFVFKIDKTAVYCYSSEVEAYEIKRDLLAAGFKDFEFQIILEYTRGWGMM